MQSNKQIVDFIELITHKSIMSKKILELVLEKYPNHSLIEVIEAVILILDSTIEDAENAFKLA